MKAEIIKLSKSEVEFKIEVSDTEWQIFLEEASKKLSKNLKIDGFRPGFVPFNLVEEKIGIAPIFEEAAEDCIKKYYLKAILENNIEAIGHPEISILKMAKNNPFEFKAKVAVMPEVKLPDYKKIASEEKKNKILVEDKEVEEALSWLQKSRAKFSQKLGICENNDWVEIKLKVDPQDTRGEIKADFSANVIGENFSREEIKDSFILGQGKLIPGIEEKIIGMSAGEEKEFSLTFPENYYRKELTGKNAKIWIKLESVQKMELPKIDNDFIKSLGNFKDLETLKKSLKEGINLEKEMAESQRIRQEILKKIIEKSKMEIPEILISNLKNQMIADLKQNISQKIKISFEEYLSKINKTEKELLDSFSLEAEKRAKSSLILREILKKEKIEISQDELEKGVSEILKANPDFKNLDQEQVKNYTEDVMKNEKIFKFLENLTK